MFHPKGGPVGWTSFPFLLFLEGISPVIEVAGHIFFLTCYFLGLISGEGAFSFLLLSFGTGFLLSISSIFLGRNYFSHISAKNGFDDLDLRRIHRKFRLSPNDVFLAARRNYQMAFANRIELGNNDAQRFVVCADRRKPAIPPSSAEKQTASEAHQTGSIKFRAELSFLSFKLSATFRNSDNFLSTDLLCVFASSR